MLPAQLVIVFNHFKINAETCASELMTTPEAAALVHRIVSALDFVQARAGWGSTLAGGAGLAYACGWADVCVWLLTRTP